MTSQGKNPEQMTQLAVLPNGTTMEVAFIHHPDVDSLLGSLAALPFFSESPPRPEVEDNEALAKIIDLGIYDILTSSGVLDRYAMIAIGATAVIGIQHDNVRDENDEHAFNEAMLRMMGGNYMLFVASIETGDVELEDK